MPEAKVDKQQSVAKRENTAVDPWRDFFSPAMPASRFFGFNPFAAMREFSEQMDRMFRGSDTRLEAWTPAVDIQRCNGNLVVAVELPGMQKDEVKVEATDDSLIIQGERKREHQEDHEGFHRYERSYGKFYRAIPLPEGANVDQVKGEMQEGVLRISMPVAEPKQARQIPVNPPAEKKAVGA